MQDFKQKTDFVKSISDKRFKHKKGKTIVADKNNTSTYLSIEQNRIDLVVNDKTSLTIKDGKIKIGSQKLDISQLYNNISIQSFTQLSPTLQQPIPSSAVTPLPVTTVSNPFQLLTSIFE